MTFQIRILFPANVNGAAYADLVGEMPALTGSPKQVAWAEELRARAARSVANEMFVSFGIKIGTLIRSDADYVAELQATLDAKLASTPRAKLVLDAIDTVFGNTDARFWIDNRDRNTSVIVLNTARR